MATKKNDVEIAEQNSYNQLANIDMAEAMAEELDGLDAGFERIKIPSGGSTMFEMPGDDADEPDMVKEFSAVILYHHALNAYYQEKYTGGNNPPDCGSYNGLTGEGAPGGNCAVCPLNKFGSADEGNGKACKNRRRIYLLCDGEIFPMLLSLPTGSLKEYARYLKRLLSKGKKSNSVVTRFSLKKAVSSGGVTYSQAQFSVDRDLSTEEFAHIAKMTEQVKAAASQVAFEYDSGEGEAPVAGADTAPMVDPETGEIIQPL